MSLSEVKIAIALGGVGAIGTGGYVVIKGLSSTSLKIRESLLKEKYELISNISDKNKRIEQYKKTFSLYKSDSEFLKEINKYKEGEVILSSSDDGEKGKVALEKLCSDYLDGTDVKVLKNAQKWCVLRIMDKEVSGKNWISLDGNEDAKWQTSFNSNKNLLVSLKIEGIIDGTEASVGHPKVKEWCTTNTKLIINKNNKDVANSTYQICTEASTPA